MAAFKLTNMAASMKVFRVLLTCTKSKSIGIEFGIIRRFIRAERSSVVRWIKAVRQSTLESLENPHPPPLPKEDAIIVTKQKVVVQRGDRSLIVTSENQHERLLESVTPLCSMPYDEQLRFKYRLNKEILKEMGTKLKEAKTAVKRDSVGLPCQLNDIIPSPVINEYRNKDEFRVKVGVDGNPKTVGFLVGSLSQGTAVCVNPTHIVNMKSTHKKVAMAFEAYIRQSPLPMCDLFSDGGYWRGINVRSNLSGDIMATVIIHPQDLTKEQINKEKELLRDYFQNGDGHECRLTSLYFQACKRTRCTSEQAPFQLVFGETHIYEELLGLRFRISPDAFFQVNTRAAEFLYEAVLKLSGVDEETVVLDVCSGTGTISLVMAPYVRATVGIESVMQAVQDAKVNAQLNKIKNATFHYARAEEILQNLTSTLLPHKVVAIVNPSRSGLHPKAIRALRKCEAISRIVYISCKPRGEAMDNIIAFAQPSSRQHQGNAYLPTVAVPLDMFPHTEHCELIIVLDRKEFKKRKEDFSFEQ